MRNRKEVVNELFELRFKLALLKRGNDDELKIINERIKEVRTEIIEIDRTNCLKERGRLK